MNLKQALALAGITISAFVFNCSEFMPVGLLVDIGDTFGTTEAQTGMIVSVYAWCVMIFSVPLMILGTKLSYRPLFLTISAIFFVGQVCTVFAINYYMMICARLIVAAAHCIFWAAGPTLAVRLVDEEKRSLALSIFEIGAAAALVVGMPIGRAIGLAIGWRATFAIVAGASALLFIYMFITLPQVKSEEAYKFSQFPTLFKNKGLVTIFILTALFAWGYYTGYSYIEPFLLQVANMHKDMITMVLMVLGLSGVVSCLFASKVYPRFRLIVFAIFTAGVPCASLIIATSANAGMTWPIFLACVIWGICGSGVAVVYQAEVINVTKPHEESVAMAFFSGIYNFGIGFGAFLGGRVVDSVGIEYVFGAGGALGLIGLLFCIFIAARQVKKYPVRL